jgi:hypothetical protein
LRNLKLTLNYYENGGTPIRTNDLMVGFRLFNNFLAEAAFNDLNYHFTAGKTVEKYEYDHQILYCTFKCTALFQMPLGSAML